MVAEYDRLFESREQCRLADELWAIRAVEYNVSRLQRIFPHLALLGRHTPQARPIQRTARSDIVHSDLYDATGDVFARRETRVCTLQNVCQLDCEGFHRCFVKRSSAALSGLGFSSGSVSQGGADLPWAIFV